MGQRRGSGRPCRCIACLLAAQRSHLGPHQCAIEFEVGQQRNRLEIAGRLEPRLQRLAPQIDAAMNREIHRQESEIVGDVDEA